MAKSEMVESTRKTTDVAGVSQKNAMSKMNLFGVK